jgi:O-succinylbenzoic acid--CoA ligase
LDKIDHIETLIIGGAPISKKLEKKIAAIKTNIFSTFGMTETVTHFAAKKLNHQNADDKNDSYFKLFPNVEILTDVNGCLVIDAPRISDKIIVTNDLVKIYEDSKFKWLGRLDNIINSGGVKIVPEQVELKLQKIISNRFFISSIPDDILGEKVILLIESKINKKLDFYKKQLDNLGTLNKYETPKKIFLLENFQETETKKIQRQKTLDLLFK